MILALFLSPALATDVDGTVGDLTYEGALSQNASGYVKGKAVSVAHNGGNISVRCMDTEKLSARLPYTVIGSAEGPMEAAGKAVAMRAGTDGKGGGLVSTKMPGKSSGVSSIDAPLTVNVPAGVSGLTGTQSGSGWVQIQDCSGALKVTAGSGGAFASGTYTSVSMTAAGGDVKLVQNDNAVLTGSSSISAPGGNATVVFGTAQGGKLNARGGEVSVQQTVNGSVTGTAVSGQMGVSGPSISVSAKERVDISAQ